MTATVTTAHANDLISVLAECADACNQCAVACLAEEHVKTLRNCIRLDLDLDCAQICQLTSTFISKGSPFSKHVLKLCAEACRQCAAECEKHSDMGHCRRCAEICNKCIEMCEGKD